VSYLFFGLLAAHIAVGAAIAVFFIRLARRHGKSGLKFSVPIVVGSYLLVFWDVIPTAVVHNHLCRTQAGVTIYKDANSWVAENPEEAKNVHPFLGKSLFQLGNDRRGYWLNTRFYVDDDTRKVSLIPVYINVQSIKDANTSAVLVEKRWISSGYRQSNDNDLDWLKGWVGLRNCFAQLDDFNEQHRMYSNVNGARK